MLCSDTGALEAIHIPKETIELAQELQPILDMIRNTGQGDGTIVMKVTGGRIGFLDFTVRWLLGKYKKSK